MYKTAAMPAEQSRESTGKKVLVPLSRYEQALFRRDMSQHCVRLSSCCGWSHEAVDGSTHSPHGGECVYLYGGGVRGRARRRRATQNSPIENVTLESFVT